MVDPLLPTYETLGKALVHPAKRWRTLRRERKAELDAIANVFGDPEQLARYYVEPDCQRHNPADVDEDDPIGRHRSPMWRSLATFLVEESPTNDGRNQLFILSDAGMGKTSLLVMLKLAHLNQVWPDGLDYVLKKIGPGTLAEVRAISSQRNTVLLLDSLDGYCDAWGRVPEYLAELLLATTHFRRVVITCRTQFFPKTVHPEATPELVVLSGFRCPVEYLSPFDDGQADAFIRRVYPRGALLLGSETERRSKARRILRAMGSLRSRPMLLSYIADIMRVPDSTQVPELDEFWLYGALVEQWLLREEIIVDVEHVQLYRACTLLALELTRLGTREFSLADLKALTAKHEELQGIPHAKLVGRSLLSVMSNGEYRFSHYSLQEYLAVAAGFKPVGE